MAKTKRAGLRPSLNPENILAFLAKHQTKEEQCGHTLVFEEVESFPPIDPYADSRMAKEWTDHVVRYCALCGMREDFFSPEDNKFTLKDEPARFVIYYHSISGSPPGPREDRIAAAKQDAIREKWDTIAAWERVNL